MLEVLLDTNTLFCWRVEGPDLHMLQLCIKVYHKLISSVPFFPLDFCLKNTEKSPKFTFPPNKVYKNHTILPFKIRFNDLLTDYIWRVLYFCYGKTGYE